MVTLDEWLSTREAAALARYHPHHILRLIKRNEIKARKWGNAWMINRESLLLYLVRVNGLGEKRGPKPEKRLEKIPNRVLQ